MKSFDCKSRCISFSKGTLSLPSGYFEKNFDEVPRVFLPRDLMCHLLNNRLFSGHLSWDDIGGLSTIRIFWGLRLSNCQSQLAQTYMHPCRIDRLGYSRMRIWKFMYDDFARFASPNIHRGSIKTIFAQGGLPDVLNKGSSVRKDFPLTLIKRVICPDY